MNPAGRVFRCSFVTLWCVATGICAVFGALLYILTLSAGMLVLPGPIAVLVFLLGTFLALGLYSFPVRVTPEAIRCYDYFGLYRSVRWPSITSIGKKNLLVLRFLVVRSEQDGVAIYVPLFLADKKGFAIAVRECAGPEHLLTKALDEAFGRL